MHRYTEHYALNSNCHTEKVGPNAMYTLCFSQNNIENIRLYQIHNHRDRVHNVVGFTFAGPRHKLVGHRYEIYISQIAINLFHLMKILSFHYHRHKTLSRLDS
jgi:hypothetical protein